MFSHIMVGANDIQEAKQFYDATFGALGQGSGMIDDKGRCSYMANGGIFVISKPIDNNPACHGNGSTFGFVAADAAAVDAWQAAGVANGGTACEEPPGVREGGAGKMYLAYLRDPSGNKLCAMYRMG